MYIIGLCGRSGSGKSTVADILSERGVFSIDADEVCRYVYDNDADCVNELSSIFGKVILNGGKISRSVLKERAYSIENGFELLNSVAHKYIVIEIERRLTLAKAAGKRFALIDAPLLFESGLDKRCDVVIAVVSPRSVAIERLVLRDGENESALRRRLALQLPTKQLVTKSDFVIVNDGNLSQLRRRAYLSMLYLQLKLGALDCGKGGRYYVKKTD